MCAVLFYVLIMCTVLFMQASENVKKLKFKVFFTEVRLSDLPNIVLPDRHFYLYSYNNINSD